MHIKTNSEYVLHGCLKHRFAWATEARKRKWSWAGSVAQRVDNRWSQQVLLWIPSHGRRARGHPKTRWLDDITAYFRVNTAAQTDDEWYILAQDAQFWQAREQDYVGFVS